MKHILSILISFGVIFSSASQSLALDYPVVLLNVRVIVNQPGFVRLAADWQVHLDKITKIYEFDKQSKSYSELKSILGGRIGLYENLHFSDNSEQSKKSRLSALLIRLPAKQSFQILESAQRKWPVIKNPDGSIDVAFRVYDPDSRQKVFYRFKEDDPQYSTIEQLVGDMELKSTKFVAPFFDNPKFDQLFTQDRIFYLNESEQ